MKKTFSILEEEDLLTYLEKHTDYSKKKLRSMLSHRQILVNQKKVLLPYRLKKNDQITLTTEKVIAPPFPILYEDDKFLVVNKRSGLLSVSDGKDHHTLYQEVRDYLSLKQEHVFIVHRLDKDTSGIVLFAKSDAVKRELQASWNDLVRSRKYVAVVQGECAREGVIKSFLHEEQNTFVHSSSNGKLAITKYHILKTKGNYHLLDISIETGRKNQIRVHMKENHTPILGDKKYGKKDDYPRLFLHAYQLELYYPKEKKMYRFETEIPKEFLKIVSF